MSATQPTNKSTRPNLAEAIQRAFRKTEYQTPAEILALEEALGGSSDLTYFIERGMAFGLLAKGMNDTPQVQTYYFLDDQAGQYKQHRLARIFVQIDAALVPRPLVPTCLTLYKDLDSQKYYTGMTSGVDFIPESDSKYGMCEADAHLKMVEHCLAFASNYPAKRDALSNVVLPKDMPELPLLYRAGKAVVDGVLTYFQRSPA